MSRFKKTAQTADPFASAEVAGSKSGQKRFLQARATGVLRAPNCDLTKLPAELTQAAGNDGEEKWWELKPLTILELQNNLFSELPSLPFPELLVLDLGSNKLTALPNELFDHLKLLKKLNLSQNQLVTLPDSLGTLTQLQELSVTHNKLQSLPASLGSSLGAYEECCKIYMSEFEIRLCFIRSNQHCAGLQPTHGTPILLGGNEAHLSHCLGQHASDPTRDFALFSPVPRAQEQPAAVDPQPESLVPAPSARPLLQSAIRTSRPPDQ